MPFTPVGSVRLAVTNVAASLDLSTLTNFQYGEKSGNFAADDALRRRPTRVRLAYIATGGQQNCYFAIGAAGTVATANSSEIAPLSDVLRVLRYGNTTLSYITANAGDTGFLTVEVGFGDTEI